MNYLNHRIQVLYSEDQNTIDLIKTDNLPSNLLKSYSWILYDTKTDDYWNDQMEPEDAVLVRDMSPLVEWIRRLVDENEKLQRDHEALQAKFDRTKDLLDKYLYKD